MQFDVFLSHANEDYNIVRRVWDLLDRMNIAAYMYELYPQYGEILTEAIRKAINDSKIFVTFLTRNGVSSQWVNQEIGVAHAIGRKIIPVKENDVESRGFVELRIFLPFSPNDPELMIYNLITRLRELLSLCDVQPNRLRIRCASCINTFQTDLPSCKDLSEAFEKGLSLGLKCPHCHNEVHVNPLTFDETGL